MLFYLILCAVLWSCANSVQMEHNVGFADSVRTHEGYDGWSDSFKRTHHSDSLVKISGDFNGDGTLDSAYVIEPYTYAASDRCLVCKIGIAFSNGLDTLNFPLEAIDAQIHNVGDLNGDGGDEILVIPDWFNSCLGMQYLYTFTKNEWKKVTEGSVYVCGPEIRIEKMSKDIFQMKVHDVTGQDTIKIFQMD